MAPASGPVEKDNRRGAATTGTEAGATKRRQFRPGRFLLPRGGGRYTNGSSANTLGLHNRPLVAERAKMEHIVKAFDEELGKLHAAIQEMGRLAVAQVDNAIQAVANRDAALAAQVAEGDAPIDRLDEAVNAQVVRLLTLRAPLADDLRVTVTGLRVANSLERVGDYAANIARRAPLLPSQPPKSACLGLQRMGKLVHGLLVDVLQAYADSDRGKAESVWMRDREVDELHSSLFREMLTYMMEDTRQVAACTHLLFIAKNIERIGDKATNIGEMVCFMADGRAIDGGRPKHDLASTTSAMD